MPGSDKKNRTEFLDEALVLAHSGVISLLPDHVMVHPGFVEDNTPLNEQQIDVEPVTTVSGDAPGRGVRLLDESVFFEPGEDAPDRCRRDAETRSGDQKGRGNRFA